MQIDWTITSVIVTVIGVIIAYLQLVRTPKLSKNKENEKSKDDSEEDDQTGPDPWQGISPPNSKYKTVTKKSDSLPGGVQNISLEYDIDGHAHPLNLKGSLARCEIQFTCQINSPYKAVYAANQYAMNFLPAQFLLKSRSLLESYSIKGLQENREYISKEIVSKFSDYFDEFGFDLLTVTIGAVTKIQPK